MTALAVKQKLNINDSNGKITSFYDTTGAYSVNNTGGYGSPNLTYAQVGGVRLRISRFIGEWVIKVGETGKLTQYREYIKTKGTAKEYDDKSIGVGNYFIPQIADIVVQEGDEFTETGFYNPLIAPSRWKPTAEGTPLYLDGNELGLSTDSVIPNSILSIQYEVYGILKTSGFTSVSGVSYLVTSGIVSYKGDNYRTGEVFQATDASSVALVSGTFGVAPYESGSYQTFQLAFSLNKDLVELNISLINNPKPKPREFIFQINEIYSNLYTIEQMSGLGAVSLQQAFDNLVNCQNEIESLKRLIY